MTEPPTAPGTRRDPDLPPPEESRLRSATEVTGYGVRATDGDIGHVEDFLMEEPDWVIRYIVVDTRNWLPGRKVLVAPGWADAVDYRRAEVHVRMNRDAVENSPPFDPDAVLGRSDERRLFDHYGERPYW